MELSRSFGFWTVGLGVQTNFGRWIVRWIDPGRWISDEMIRPSDRGCVLQFMPPPIITVPHQGHSRLFTRWRIKGSSPCLTLAAAPPASSSSPPALAPLLFLHAMAPRPLPHAAISGSSSSFASCLIPAPHSTVSCSSRRAAVSQSGVSPGGAKLRICHFSPRRSEGAMRPELGRAGAGASSSRGRAPAEAGGDAGREGSRRQGKNMQGLVHHGEHPPSTLLLRSWIPGTSHILYPASTNLLLTI